MAAVLGALALLLVIVIVLARVQILKRAGITAMKFGTSDRTDFAIPPFALFYVYLVLSNAFGWPTFAHGTLFTSAILQWFGVTTCLAGVALMLASIVSFGESFRVGIDTAQPGSLITTGIFAYTRNPIYVAFGALLAGEFLIDPHWLFFAYLVFGIALFHRQVLREESALEHGYGAEYEAYKSRVRRYL